MAETVKKEKEENIKNETTSVETTNDEIDNDEASNGGKKKNKIFIFIVLLIIIAAIVCAFFALNSDNFGSENAIKASKEVSNTNINKNEVTGTGIIEAENQYDITASVTGDILAAPFEEGQNVKAGELLYKLDSTDIQNAIAKSKIGIEKAQLAFDQTADNINKLNVRSNISGTISKLYYSSGDVVQPNAKVADVINNDVMVLKVPFIEDTASNIYPGQSADISIVGTFYNVQGTVKKITSGHMVTSDGSVVKTVEINVNNPGSINKGDKGTAIIGNVACNDAGIFDYSDTSSIIAEVAGKIGTLTYSEGDHINKSDILVSLTSDSLSSQQEQNSVNIKDAKLALENQNNQLKKYNLTSPIGGTVIKKNLKKGEKVDMATKGPLATVADLSKIIFKMNVDELDIAKVKVGQSVKLAADAIANKEYIGTVDSISNLGVQVNGVTLYEVKIVVDNSQGLMPGMNVNAKITID